MSVQSEQQLELELIAQLQGLGFTQVSIRNEQQLLANLKTQIERSNVLAPLSADEWKQVISHLNSGTLFERAKQLRDLFPIKFDDGSSRHIRFLFDDPSQNHYQVTHQISVDHRDFNARSSRFDVTLLINGLPLIQIELKRRGVEIAEAFNQTLRYTREAYWAGQGLFSYIQLFVISNGVNSRYYANGTQLIDFAFPWADSHNRPINELTDFSEAFLTPSHLTQMLTQYMVMHEGSKQLMVLRPYQIYAVQRIVAQVQNTQQNGYIWHTTGSGKTLTSFKASQIIMKMPQVEKVLFVVDRSDLDTQTAKEFNAFKADSVDSTNNTHTLVKQLDQRHDKLIVTTLQKLNRAISTDRYLEYIEYLKDKKVVFIFDECHRSQFGETHRNIKKFFKQAQMFGFTGTPIFEQNSLSQAGLKLTTDALFDTCLHQYVIVDAIRDRNVLQFQIDYRGKYTAKGMANNHQTDDHNQEDEVEGIDTQELYNNPKRLEMITRYIVNHHDTKTKDREFNAMFCVSSVEILTQYYAMFEQVQAQKQIEDAAQGRIFKPLRIATIFSYAANETVAPREQNNGLIDEEAPDIPTQINRSNRDKLDHCIAQYNQQFKSNFNSGDRFYAYYKDIADRVKNKQIDLLIVVNMFLTGFDAKSLNTLYVDKNLKYHGLIQAFSRTNRVYNANKPFGNIICFRNLKHATDQALALFSNKAAKAVVLVPSFSEIQKSYNDAVLQLLKLTPDHQAVDDLLTEEQQLDFIKAFREVMRQNTRLQTFVEYDQDQSSLNKQCFANFASKYSDLCRAVKKTSSKEKVSVLDDVDFQLDLLHRDRINVGYIISLLQLLVDSDSDQQQQQYQAQIHDLISSDIRLHDKQVLIQKFIAENMPKMLNGQSVQEAFAAFWDVEKEQAYQHLCEQENLHPEVMQQVLADYEYTQRLPRKEELTTLPKFKIKLFERENVLNHILSKTRQLIERFYTGL